MFYGYCYPEPDGWHTPYVTLKDAGEVFCYIRLQSKLFREVRITDEDDYIVAQVIDGVIVHPVEWQKLQTVIMR